MMGTTHAAFALLCYYAIAYFIGLPFFAATVLTLLVVGSLLPDIDHPKIFFIQQSYLFRRVSRRVGKFTHRGIIHSLSAALIATFIVWALSLFYNLEPLAVLGFFLGYMSHLTIDSLNPTGIAWLQPIKKAKVSNGIRTGSAMEKTFFFLSILGILTLFYATYPDFFSKFLELGLLGV